MKILTTETEAGYKAVWNTLNTINEVLEEQGWAIDFTVTIDKDWIGTFKINGLDNLFDTV